MYNSTVWCKCMAEFPASFLARDLLAAYQNLERLYWRRIKLWLLRPLGKRWKEAYRDNNQRIREERVNIRFLGGKIPPFWS